MKYVFLVDRALIRCSDAIGSIRIGEKKNG